MLWLYSSQILHVTQPSPFSCRNASEQHPLPSKNMRCNSVLSRSMRSSSDSLGRQCQTIWLVIVSSMSLSVALQAVRYSLFRVRSYGNRDIPPLLHCSIHNALYVRTLLPCMLPRCFPFEILSQGQVFLALLS